RGELAWRIINEAKKYGIPLYEDEQLANMLMRLPLDSEIPPELYQAVAEVLAFIYRLDREKHR
ncbi:MAG: EscU/YscU/HrcU family type III secretion system export apparatus switch protein, partial [Thermacetogeniaceae bacterium]